MSNAHNIIVTGGNGRLGQALARQGCTALSHDQLDITRPGGFGPALDRYRPSVIINAAAYTAVDDAEKNEAAARAINADGAGNIANYCAASGIPLIHISTDMVFSEGSRDHPLDETAKPAPAAIYGTTKLEGEHAVRAAGGPHIVARVSWLFDRTGASFISKMLEIAARKSVLQLVSDETGRPTPADPLATQLLMLAERAEKMESLPSTLHLGPGPAVSRFEWAQRIFSVSEAAGSHAPALEPVTGAQFRLPAKRSRGVVLDTSAAERLLGPMPDWRPECDAAVRHLLGPGA